MKYKDKKQISRYVRNDIKNEIATFDLSQIRNDNQKADF